MRRAIFPLLYLSICFARGSETFFTLLPQTKHMVCFTPYTAQPRIDACSELVRVGSGI